MGKPKINDKVLHTLIQLRKSGKSVKEIVKELKLGNGTVSKYCKGVVLNGTAQQILEAKKYPAKKISLDEKEQAMKHAKKIISNLNNRDFFIIISALYWGEGTKKELNLINGDPKLIAFFVKGLLSLGIEKNRIKVSIRYYSNQHKEVITKFWLDLLALDSSNIVGFERVKGNGSDKLVNGMCRVRVQKSSYCHKLIVSAIEIISSGSSNG